MQKLRNASHSVNEALLTSVACDDIENNNEIALIKHDEVQLAHSIHD